MAYRVLTTQKTQSVTDEKEGLLLDCDTILTAKEFDADMKKNAGQVKRQNEWKGSDLEVWLNGNDFYGNSSVFSKGEQAAITETSLAEDTEGYTLGEWTYADFGTADHVFLLSAAEAYHSYFGNETRIKTGSTYCWWLRSALTSAGNGAGSVHSDGHVCNNSLKNVYVGVSPCWGKPFFSCGSVEGSFCISLRQKQVA